MLSVIAPCYNEASAIGPFEARTRPVLDGLNTDYQVVLIDDGSTDATALELARLGHEWPQVVVVTHSDNLGQQAALSSGMTRAQGDIVITMDVDLQDPPELIPHLLAASHGVDVVYARRDSRPTDTLFTRVSAGGFYWLIARILGVQVIPNAADFRLMSRPAVLALLEMPEADVFRVSVPWLGLPSATVPYAREARVAGSGHYNLARMLWLAWRGVRCAVRLRLAGRATSRL